MPWLAIADARGTAYRGVGWAELIARSPVPYERALLVWPFVCWGLLAVAGCGLLVASSRPGLARRAGVAFRVLGCVAGFVLLLTGARWLGFYLARLADLGPSPVHLHVVPVLHLASGGLVLAWSLVRLRGAWGQPPWPTRRHPQPVRTALAFLWLFAGALLAMPLLPHAVLEENGRSFHYDELTVAVLGASGGAAAQPAEDLSWIRGLAWAGVASSAIVLALALWARTPSWPVRWPRLVPDHAVWALLPTLAALAFFGVRLALDLQALAVRPRLGINFVPQLVSLAGAFLLAAHVVGRRNAALAARAG